jgi:hypothetical protein
MANRPPKSSDALLACGQQRLHISIENAENGRQIFGCNVPISVSRHFGGLFGEYVAHGSISTRPTTQRIRQARYQYIQLVRISGASVDIAIRPHDDSADLTRSDPIGKYPVGFDEGRDTASRRAFPGAGDNHAFTAKLLPVQQ